MSYPDWHIIDTLIPKKPRIKPLAPPPSIPTDSLPEPPNLTETGPRNKRIRFRDYLISVD